MFVMGADKAWKERAKGEVKLLKHRTTGRARCLLRQEKTLKIRANFTVAAGLQLKPQGVNGKEWVWTALDGSDEYGESARPVVACALRRDRGAHGAPPPPPFSALLQPAAPRP